MKTRLSSARFPQPTALKAATQVSPLSRCGRLVLPWAQAHVAADHRPHDAIHERVVRRTLSWPRRHRMHHRITIAGVGYCHVPRLGIDVPPIDWVPEPCHVGTTTSRRKNRHEYEILPPSNGVARFRGVARTSDRRWDMEDAGLSRRHMLRAAGALGALTAVGGPAVVFAQPATSRHRLDLPSIDFTTGEARAGGNASAMAVDRSLIKLTGSGTFRESPGDAQAVTSGGEWSTSAAASARTAGPTGLRAS